MGTFSLSTLTICRVELEFAFFRYASRQYSAASDNLRCIACSLLFYAPFERADRRTTQRNAAGDRGEPRKDLLCAGVIEEIAFQMLEARHNRRFTPIQKLQLLKLWTNHKGEKTAMPGHLRLGLR